MGYETTYNGRIKVDKDIIKKLKEEFKDEDLDEHFGIEGIDVGDDYIDICGYGKLYEEELENFCYFIAKIDNKAVGEMECSGEDSGDFWSIDIIRGEVCVKEGMIVYGEDGRNHINNIVNKDVYKITKDKELLKEIIVEELVGKEGLNGK